MVNIVFIVLAVAALWVINKVWKPERIYVYVLDTIIAIGICLWLATILGLIPKFL